MKDKIVWNKDIFKNKQSLIVFILGIITFLTLAIGLTYAYFSIQVTGNEEASSMIVTTATLSLEYEDHQIMELNNAYPGAIVSKEVKVKNTGTVGVSYAIGFVDMENTFEGEELFISYTCRSYSYYGTENEVDNGECYPLEAQWLNPAQSVVEEGIYIGTDETQILTIAIEFKEIATAQDYNQGKVFRGTLNIADGITGYTMVGLVLKNDGSACVNCVVEVHSKVRTATTDEDGMFRMPKVLQGIHTVKVYESDSLLFQGPIEVLTADVAKVENDEDVYGKKGDEELYVQFKGDEETKVINTINLLPLVSLTINLDGGLTPQTFDNYYIAKTRLTLIEPTKTGYTFAGWTTSTESANITDNLFILGTSETSLTANWKYIPLLTVNLNSGSTNQSFNDRYSDGTTITLTNPTRTNYAFVNWSVTGVGASVTNNILTMGTGDATITANWQRVYTCSKEATPVYTCSVGSISSGSTCTYSATANTTCTTSLSTSSAGFGSTSSSACSSKCSGTYGGRITCSTCGGSWDKNPSASYNATKKMCTCRYRSSCTGTNHTTYSCPSGGSVSGTSCNYTGTLSSYSCTTGTVNESACYLYNQTSCASGWTTVN